MATFPDDFVRLHLGIGTRDIPLGALGLEWPPPDRIVIDPGRGAREPTPDDPPAFIMRRVSHSRITDDQRAGMTHVARGAEYVYEEDERDHPHRRRPG